MADEVVLVREEVVLLVETTDPAAQPVDVAWQDPAGIAPESPGALVLVREEVVLQVEIGDPEVVIVEAGFQGPPGAPGGTSEDDMNYAKRSDIVGENTIYRGRAAPGSLDSQPVWQIWVITIGEGGDSADKFAGGTAAFDKVWDDRLTLEYV